MAKVKLRPPSGFTKTSDMYYILDVRSKSNKIDFVFPPEAITETPNAPNYQTTDIVGRSSQLEVWVSNGNRKIDFGVTFVDDYYDLTLDKVKSRLSSMQMPEYSSGKATAPEVQLRLGKVVARGTLSNLSFNAHGPIRNGLHTQLDVQMTITDLRLVPIGASQVRNGEDYKER